MKFKIFVLLSMTVLFLGCNSPAAGTYRGEGVHFQVNEGFLGIKTIEFSADNRRFDNFLITFGSFNYQWGESGGTHCPTDAYIINGYFTSSTTASGWIRRGRECVYGAMQHFSVELQQ